jgi:hypothetical protein
MADFTPSWLGAGAEQPEDPDRLKEVLADPDKYARKDPPPIDPITAALIPLGGGPADVIVLYGFLWRAGKPDAARKAVDTAEAARAKQQLAKLVPSLPETVKTTLGPAAQTLADEAKKAAGEARRSADQGEVRLYTSWLLDEYIDLTGIEIKYWRKIPYDSGTVVWIARRHSSLKLVQVPQPHSAPATFLGGTIAGTYLSGAPPEAWRDPLGATLTPDTALCATPRHGCG